MEAYRVFEWDRRYEVTDKGGEYKGQGKKRSTGLRYVRMANHGYSVGPGRQKLRLIAGPRAREVSDVFNDLLQFAASHSAECRGWILTDQGNPATAEDLCFHLAATAADVKFYMETLTDPRLGWLKIEEFMPAAGDSPEIPDDSAEIPETPATAADDSAELPGRLYNETETETDTKLNETENQSQTKAPAGPGENSDSDFSSRKVSDSDSMSWQVFELKLSELLPKYTGSDFTTFRNLTNHLHFLQQKQPGIFDEALKLAKSCRFAGVRNPKARFIAACKKNFGFKATVNWTDKAKPLEVKCG